MRPPRMSRKVLVTGGAGFIGSHLVDQLVAEGHEVTVFDNLEPQVHARKPAYLNPGAKYVWGDVRDRAALRSALADQEVVYHQAAMVGVGQSMYQVERYVGVNTMGTALLLDLLVNEPHHVKKLIVASSMSIYGEGAYLDAGGSLVSPQPRPSEQMARHEWELRDAAGRELKPIGTPETKPLDSTSVYAISKKDQEEYCLVAGKAYGIPTVALRYFNVYGPRQSLNNPYTGVCAIFSSRIKNGNPPVIYEDGQQSRDFVAVEDIVQANLLAMKKSGADHQAVNVGTGRPTTVRQVADALSKLYGRPDLQPLVENKYRAGDIRHCVADVSKARRLLGYEPKVDLEEGMRRLVAWGEKEPAVDKFDEVARELSKRNLTTG
jgi:dTDP-L-rhamnose 4-epimerase